MAEPQPPAKRGNFLTRKHGPLPMWAYIVIAVGLLVALAWWKTRQSSQQSQDSGPSSAAGSGQVPQFVNQTYVQPGPPNSEKPDDDDDKHKRHHRGGHRPHRRSHEPEPVRHPGGTGGGHLPGGGTFGPPPQRGGGTPGRGPGGTWLPTPGG